jgi:hypothetical protein
LRVPLCMALPTPAARPLATDLRESVGVDTRRTGLPPSSDHNGVNAMGCWARKAMARRVEREPVDQPRLAATPLPVAARASFSAGMWPEAVMDRPTDLDG